MGIARDGVNGESLGRVFEGRLGVGRMGLCVCVFVVLFAWGG